MYRLVVLSVLMISDNVKAPPPFRLTIDCGSQERESRYDDWDESARSATGSFDVGSFCNLIQKAIPKAVKDGRFVLMNGEPDQSGFGNTIVPISVAPPNGFIPKFPKLKAPKLKIPRINVPRLASPGPDRPLSAPRVGSPMSFSKYREPEEESSAEKMEKFKKGVQKMLHVVKVLGQIDQYLSERTRIIIDKLTKTFAE